MLLKSPWTPGGILTGPAPLVSGAGVSLPSLFPEQCSLTGPEEHPKQKLCHLPTCAIPAVSLHPGNGCAQPCFQIKTNKNRAERGLSTCPRSLTLPPQQGILPPRVPSLLPNTHCYSLGGMPGSFDSLLPIRPLCPGAAVMAHHRGLRSSKAETPAAIFWPWEESPTVPCHRPVPGCPMN